MKVASNIGANNSLKSTESNIPIQQSKPQQTTQSENKTKINSNFAKYAQYQSNLNKKKIKRN